MNASAELKREYAQLSTTFRSGLSLLQWRGNSRSQIDDIEASLREERKRAADSIVNDYSAALHRENLFQQALEHQQKEVNLVAEKSVQYNILKREVDTNKQLYEGLQQRMKKAGLSAGLKASNIHNRGFR